MRRLRLERQRTGCPTLGRSFHRLIITDLRRSFPCRASPISSNLGTGAGPSFKISGGQVGVVKHLTAWKSRHTGIMFMRRALSRQSTSFSHHLCRLQCLRVPSGRQALALQGRKTWHRSYAIEADTKANDVAQEAGQAAIAELLKPPPRKRSYEPQRSVVESYLSFKHMREFLFKQFQECS